jgi:hypothetical protein
MNAQMSGFGGEAEFVCSTRALRKMSAPAVERLKAYLREHLPIDRNGRIAYAARANAVKGSVPV